MPLSTTLPNGLDEVDIIIAGGGVAGCVVAGRLAAADPNLVILLLEGGANNQDIPIITHGAMLWAHQAPDSKYTIPLAGKASASLAGRVPIVANGGVLGGGSSVNFMVYSRAQGGDFDSWGIPGWSKEDMLPFMKKLEKYSGRGSKNHGTDGPVSISNGPFRGVKSQDDWMDAASRLGYMVYDDLADPESINIGWERALSWVTPEGVRADAANAYVHPLMSDGRYSNVHVICQTKVVRVLFDENKRATGVEYVPNPAFGSEVTAARTIKARKQVVLSCGACSTPTVLERSGVGSSAILEKAGVNVVVDLPGVGNNYDDHVQVGYMYRTNLSPEDTLDALWQGRMSPEEAAKNGMLGWSAFDCHGKCRPTEEEVDALGPKFRAAWDRDFKDKPYRPLAMSATLAGMPGPPGLVPEGQYFGHGSYTAYSYSRGYVHITGPALSDPVDFDPGFLSDVDGLDVKALMWAYKRFRSIMRSTKMFAGEIEATHPSFPAGSEAAVISNTEDGKSVVADPKYTADDDEAIEQCIREKGTTTWHSLGTARMGKREDSGVVDEKLDVYGTKGLKVVDLSVAPTMVAANTNHTAFTVGEKGADLILRELGLLS